jgi:hypothetical protein
VKIRNHRVHAPELVARQDKEVGLALEGRDLAAHRRALQRAYGRRANRDYPASGCTGFPDRLAACPAHLHAFRMEAILRDLLVAQRLKSTRTDVQRDVRVAHA